MAHVIKRKPLSLGSPGAVVASFLGRLLTARGQIIRRGATAPEALAAQTANTFVGGDGTDVTTRTAAQVKTSLGFPTTTPDNGVPRFDGTGGNLQTSGVTIDDQNIMSGAFYRTVQVSIADDAVATITIPSNTTGYGMVAGSAVSLAGFFGFRVGSSASTTAVSSGASFTLGTGIPTGTTGPDGGVRVQTHTDQNMYIENRAGGTIAYGLAVLSR